jgi:hypothetical protein
MFHTKNVITSDLIFIECDNRGHLDGMCHKNNRSSLFAMSPECSEHRLMYSFFTGLSEQRAESSEWSNNVL